MGGITILKNGYIYNALDWIGDRSYSIYLCHIPLMHLTRETLNSFLIETPFYQNEVFYFLIFISITTASSNLSYKYVETYFISKMNKFN